MLPTPPHSSILLPSPPHPLGNRVLSLLLPRNLRELCFEWARGWKNQNGARTWSKYFLYFSHKNFKKIPLYFCIVIYSSFLTKKMSECCKELLSIVDKCKAWLFCGILFTNNFVDFTVFFSAIAGQYLGVSNCEIFCCQSRRLGKS